MSQKLFKRFKKISKKEWIEKASQDLKGLNPSDKFGWEIEPGMKTDLYYDAEDIGTDALKFQNRQLLSADHPSGKPRHWDNLQKITVEKEAEANKVSLNALKNGAEGLIFEITVDQINLNKLLQDVELPFCSVWFIINSQNKGLVPTLVKFTEKHSFHGGVLYDDEHMLAEHSDKFEPFPTIFQGAINDASQNSFTDKISSQLYETVTLAEKRISQQFKADEFFKRQVITYTLGSDFFGEIAAIRALRQLYFQVARAYGADSFNPEDLHIIAISNVWTNEQYNPHANMLKSTTAGMAAVLGGCNSLFVEPEDSTSIMNVRVARNVSNVLKEESYLNTHADPVAGSYYLETVSQQMAQEAWKKFQQKFK